MLDLVPLAQACANTAYVRAQASESIPHVLAALTKVAYRGAQEAGGVGKAGPNNAEGKEGDLTKEERAHILDMLNQEGGELEGGKAAGDESGWERGMSGGELQGGALTDRVSTEVEQDITDDEYGGEGGVWPPHLFDHGSPRQPAAWLACLVNRIQNPAFPVFCSVGG